LNIALLVPFSSKCGNHKLSPACLPGAVYRHRSNGPNTTVLGGFAEASGFDESAVRNGLLPAGFLFKAATTQDGLDLSAVFGMYPGLNNSKPGALGANSGGSPLGLDTHSSIWTPSVLVIRSCDRVGDGAKLGKI
jgi:hypothetical protein